jgi:hypothetical protein
VVAPGHSTSVKQTIGRPAGGVATAVLIAIDRVSANACHNRTRPVSMVKPDTDSGDRISLSLAKTQRDYRLSVALLIAGVAITAAFYVSEFWVNSFGGNLGYSTVFFIFEIFGGIGYTLVLVGAIFTGVNWSLLRRAHRSP